MSHSVLEAELQDRWLIRAIFVVIETTPVLEMEGIRVNARVKPAGGILEPETALSAEINHNDVDRH